jgi:hypothetical protein
MNKPRVSPEQAKMLKSLGYDVPDRWMITARDREMLTNEERCNSEHGENEYSAPTLDDAARWLREKKGWHVVVMQKNNGDWMAMPETTPRSYSNLFIDNQPDHDTALSEWISIILKKLTNAQ